jgi:hypothetical protein
VSKPSGQPSTDAAKDQHQQRGGADISSKEGDGTGDSADDLSYSCEHQDEDNRFEDDFVKRLRPIAYDDHTNDGKDEGANP